MKTLNWLSIHSFYFLILFISILSFMISSCRSTPINIESELNALQQADKSWSEACASKSVIGMLDFYDSEAYLIDLHGNVYRGKDELRKLWTNEFSNPDYSLTWQLNEANVAQAGDIGYTSGSWDLTFTSKDGKQIKYHGTYVAIWKKQTDGTWKVLVDKT